MDRLKRREHEEVVAALARRVILIKLDRRIVFANGARRARLVGLAEPGENIDENRSRFGPSQTIVISSSGTLLRRKSERSHDLSSD